MTINNKYHTPMKNCLLVILLSLLGGVETGFAQSIQLNFTFTAPSCAGFKDGTAVVAATGGTAPYTYAWNNGQQAASNPNIGAGLYTVTVSDLTGQSATGTVQVTQPAPLQASVITSVPSCGGSPGTMAIAPTGGTAPYSIIWSNGIVGLVASGLLPTQTYTAKTTDSKGCQLTTSVTVPLIDSLKVSIATSFAQCTGIDNGTASAFVLPQGGAYGYHWNVSPLNSSKLTGLPANTLVAVTVTDQNSTCSGTASAMVTAHVTMNLALETVGNIICPGDSTGMLRATASNGTPPYSYSWTGTGGAYTGSPITGLVTGTYTVTATDASGCTLSASRTIEAKSGLTANFELKSSCADEVITVDLVDKSKDSTSTIKTWNWIVTWNNGTQTYTTSDPAPFSVPNPTDLHVQLVVTSQAGCKDTLPQDLVAKAFPTVDVKTPGFTCDATPVPITVSGDSTLTYTWTPSTGLTFNPDARHVLANPAVSSMYTLVVSDGNCTDTLDSIMIIRQPPITLEANNISTCDSVGTLSASATGSSVQIFWSTLDSVKIDPPYTVHILGGVTYYVATAVDNLGCILTDTVQVDGSDLALQASVSAEANCADSSVVLAAQSLNAPSGVSFHWSANPPGLIIVNPNAANTTASGPAGQYQVTLKASRPGCPDSLVTFPVHIKPRVDASATVSVDLQCDQAVGTFNNTSGYPGIWTFGDGKTSTLDNPTHVYTTSGQYHVTFTINSDQVCAGTPFEQTADVVLNAALALEPAVEKADCVDSTLELAVQNLNANSSVSFHWSADPSGLNIVDPNASSTTATGPAGQYVVTLTASRPGCPDSLLHFPVVIKPRADASATATVSQQCETALGTFTNNSGYSGVWNFGDGKTSTLDNPTHLYTASGQYPVTFTITSDQVCPGKPFEQTLDVTVNAPLALDIHVDPSGCVNTNLELSVQNLSATSPVSFHWSAAPAGLNIADPAASSTTATGPAGQYVVTLTASRPGCPDSLMTFPVTIKPVVDATGSVSMLPQCETVLATFQNTSGYPGVWDFGDGTTSPLDNPTHAYSASNHYTVTFTISSDLVCAGAPFVQALDVVVAGPLALAVNVEAADCVDSTIELSAQNLSPGNPVTFQWSATPSGLNIVDPNAGTTTASGPAGQYLVTLKTMRPGCPDSLMSFPVRVKPRVNATATVSITPQCETALASFSNTSGFPGVWSFGDNTTSNLDNPTHIYSASGQYTVTFTIASDQVCSGTPFEQTLNVTVSAPLDFAASVGAITCEDSSLVLKVQNLNPANPVTFQWSATPSGLNIQDPNGGNTTASGPAGQYLVTLKALRPGCPDSLTSFPVQIRPVVNAAATVSLTPQCNQALGIFVNTSGYPGVWAFGDGSTSMLDSVSHLYTTPGTYPVTFTLNDNNQICVGAAFRDTFEVVVNNFTLTVADTLPVCDTTAVLTASTNHPATIVWTTAQGDTLDVAPFAVPPGTYYIAATDSLNCHLQDSVAVVSFQFEFAAQVPSDTCSNTPILLAAQNLNANFGLNFHWTVDKPTFVINDPDAPVTTGTGPAGQYVVILTATLADQPGCSAQSQFVINLVSVEVEATVTGKNPICPGDTTTLNVNATGSGTGYTYSWSPSGTLSDPNSAETLAFPTSEETYTVTVTADDVCSATGTVTVRVVETQCREPYIFVPKAFTPNGDDVNDRFRVRGVNIKELELIVYDRWGEEVYHTTNPDHEGWDGTFRGRASTPDSYGWYLRVTCVDGQLFEHKGDVTLLK